jgi:hypothetical protein
MDGGIGIRTLRPRHDRDGGMVAVVAVTVVGVAVREALEVLE